MKRILSLGVILLFSALAFAGSADASHEKYTIRYIGGGEIGGIQVTACLLDIDDETLGIGGSCFFPCPHGTCDITVTDDQAGVWTWFRIQVDDEPFFRPQSFRHQVSVEGEKVRVAVSFADATTGTITIE